MTTSLSYAQIKDGACNGWQIDQLSEILKIEHPCDPEGPLGYMDANEYQQLAKKLNGIYQVLDMLQTTANAYINREALDEMARHVLQAKAILAKKWVRGLLDRADETLKTDPSLIIPF